MSNFSQYKDTLSQLKSYVYALCEVRGNTRIPFYIGKGTGSRCLTHIKDALASDRSSRKEDKKLKRIYELHKKNLLGIDILCHGLDSGTALMVETTCIDLHGLEGLTNKINGQGTSNDIDILKQGRLTLEETASLYSPEVMHVSDIKHQGIGFILNKLYRFNMSELELFEATRGVWHNPPRKNEDIKYAYATYNNIIKEVYEIHSWVEAGTQQYFTRNINKGSGRWEFIGRKANDKIRSLYVGKKIIRDRNYAQPFFKVGFNNPDSEI
ncbi:hypothetical protein LDO51_09985 [Providencia alcalifaciens]|uniref:LEM-3-like GIY-YIG domain-containing protein n=1 Tax=Providencia alcalifaciens TaxID=126385 RepID=UPI001CE08890|nr:hypothetical protein [Providencia alcalifaciens]UBX47529.1 hypothetical protein LDO51_09985 [Providencia alcalifaciens]